MLWFFLVVMVLLLIGSIWLNVRVIKQNLVLVDQREALVDTIEAALDELESCHASIAHAAEIPVLSDEPVVRTLLADIRRAKNAVLAIAGQVVTYGVEEGVLRGE